jgi:hypothetical protein
MTIHVNIQCSSNVVVNVDLFHVWQQEEQGADELMVTSGVRRWVGNWAQATWWETLVSVMEIVQSQALLLQVVGALHAASCFASGLNSRQQQTNQNTDDGNNHQQFN